MKEELGRVTPAERKPYRFSTKEVLRLISEGTISVQTLLIDRVFLHGIQERAEYSRDKERNETVMLRKYREEYLCSCPVITTAVSTGSSTMLAVLDGHHRLRYSGRFGIHKIPCIVLSLDQAADIAGTNTETLARTLINASSLAAGSFSRLSDEKQPRLITGVTSLEKLVKQFKPFEIETETPCLD